MRGGFALELRFGPEQREQKEHEAGNGGGRAAIGPDHLAGHEAAGKDVHSLQNPRRSHTD